MAARTLHKSLAEGCWSTVIAAQGCSSGRLRWDVRVNSTRTGAVAFGLAPSAIPIVDVAPGSPVLFMPWMWMPDHQSTFTDNVRSGGFGEPIASGDTLTFTLDTDARTLAVAKNGRDMGLAFTELSSSTGALHPALALNHLLDCVTISGLPDSFVHGRSIALADKPASPLALPGEFMPINVSYPGLVKVHDNPPVYEIEGFFNEEECSAMLSRAAPHFARSAVVGGHVSAIRTSSTCYLLREVCPELISKAVALTDKPITHFELPQVARYEREQLYHSHLDSFDLKTEAGRQAVCNGGQRIGTLLVYLNDVPSGGCTYFNVLDLRVRPRGGRALLFFPCFADGSVDERMLHTAERAVDTKHIAQLWIRQSDFFGTPSALPSA